MVYPPSAPMTTSVHACEERGPSLLRPKATPVRNAPMTFTRNVPRESRVCRPGPGTRRPSDTCQRSLWPLQGQRAAHSWPLFLLSVTPPTRKGRTIHVPLPRFLRVAQLKSLGQHAIQPLQASGLITYPARAVEQPVAAIRDGRGRVVSGEGAARRVRR